MIYSCSFHYFYLLLYCTASETIGHVLEFYHPTSYCCPFDFLFITGNSGPPHPTDLSAKFSFCCKQRLDSVL